MQVTYIGPFDAVYVVGLDADVKNGESVEVDDELGKSLVEQVDNWQAAKAAKSAKADKDA